MRIARSFGWMTLLAGVATYFATQAAIRRHDERRRAESDERMRWETDGGATAAGPQPAIAALRPAG